MIVIRAGTFVASWLAQRDRRADSRTRVLTTEGVGETECLSDALCVCARRKARAVAATRPPAYLQLRSQLDRARNVARHPEARAAGAPRRMNGPNLSTRRPSRLAAFGRSRLRVTDRLILPGSIF
jgi:hypothetical protein